MSDDIAARYSRSAATYASMWSPVIRPMAQPLLQAIAPLDGLVLDVGCGVGALFDDLRAAGGRVAGLDRSAGMLGLAAARGPVACADATMLPVLPGAASAAVAIFMLHHVSDPAAALRSMADAVRPGGLVATATWGTDSNHEAGDVWDAMLNEHGAPAGTPTPDSREQMDTHQKAAAVAAGAGLTVERAWTQRAEHRYNLDGLVAMHECYGRRNERLMALPPEHRASVVAAFRAEAARRPALLTWRPDVVYAVARR